MDGRTGFGGTRSPMYVGGRYLIVNVSSRTGCCFWDQGNAWDGDKDGNGVFWCSVQ